MDSPLMNPGAAPAPGAAPNPNEASETDAQEGGEQTPDGDERQIFETMVAGLTEYMYGQGKAGIVEQLQGSDQLTQTMGEITFSLVQEAAKQAEQSGIDFDLDMLMGVAGEVIDSLIRMVQALKIKAPGEQEMREQSLMVAVQSYLNVAKPGSEEQAAAQQMLAQMHGSGMTDEAAGELQQMGQRAGVDPFAQAQQEQTEQPPPQSAGLMGS